MKKIPIGVQTFSEIINGDYLYLDKTEQIIELLDQDKYVFLSRPRRFGKSLILDTIRELLTGNKKLFKDLYAYDNWNFDNNYPVIYLSFAGKNNENTNIFKGSFVQYGNNIISYDDYCNDKKLSGNYLDELIRSLYNETGKQVVILIDEYDKYVLNNLEDTKWLNYFSDFYSGIKDSDRYLKLFIMTGLNKVLKLSLFSTLNNLNDISYKSKYSDIIGYTESDLDKYFGININNYLPEVREYYNGYTFGGKIDIYNPWALNEFVASNYTFGLYWSSTGLPSAITDYIYSDGKEVLLNILDNALNNKSYVYNPDISYLTKENIDTQEYVLALLVNSGYLTLKRTNRGFETIIPNVECSSILSSYFIQLSMLNRKSKIRDISPTEKDDLYYGILEGNEKRILNAFEGIYNIFLKDYPYDWVNKNPEGVFKILILQQLTSMNLLVYNEGQVQDGRYDLIIPINGKSIIIEAKVDDNSNNGLNQIKSQYSTYITKGSIIISINWNRKKKGDNRFNVLVEKH